MFSLSTWTAIGTEEEWTFVARGILNQEMFAGPGRKSMASYKWRCHVRRSYPAGEEWILAVFDIARES
jgi:hypothetical protein